MSDELKPCPNPACRSTDLAVVLNHYVGTWFTRCRVCLMNGAAMPTEAEAKAAWNALPRVPVWSSERPTAEGDYCVRHKDDPTCTWFEYVGLPRGRAYEYAGPYPTPLEESK